MIGQPEQAACSSLGEIFSEAAQLGCDAIAADAQALADRVRERRFFVACAGQFKRGKSTLLNAIVGELVLPTGVVPVTSVPTVLRYGPRGARVADASGAWCDVPVAEIEQYVTEEQNPRNVKGVVAVEVFLPSAILAGGLCFVDTPGISSVYAANTAATTGFLPQADAALIVLGADPPISGDELSMVEQLGSAVEDVILVLNKADRATDDEIGQAVLFTHRVVSERLGRAVDRVYVVSAKERLDGGPSRDWDALSARLRSLTDRSAQLTAEAAARGVRRMGSLLLFRIDEEAGAIRRSLAETDQHLGALRDGTEQARRALDELGPLFEVELCHIADRFADRRRRFLREAGPRAAAALAEQVASIHGLRRPAIRSAAVETAQQLAWETVAPWLAESEALADEAYRESARRFTELIAGLVDRLRDSGCWNGLPAPEVRDLDTGVRGKRRFAFERMFNVASPAGVAPLLRAGADVILPRAAVLPSAIREGGALLDRLLEVNVCRVENGLKQRLQDSRMALESELRLALRDMLRNAGDAAARAVAVQADGEAAVAGALESLRSARERLVAAIACVP